MTEDTKPTPEGAVELTEDKLEDASGGILIGLNQPSLPGALPGVQPGIKIAPVFPKISDGTSNYKV